MSELPDPCVDCLQFIDVVDFEREGPGLDELDAVMLAAFADDPAGTLVRPGCLAKPVPAANATALARLSSRVLRLLRCQTSAVECSVEGTSAACTPSSSASTFLRPCLHEEEHGPACQMCAIFIVPI